MYDRGCGASWVTLEFSVLFGMGPNVGGFGRFGIGPRQDDLFWMIQAFKQQKEPVNKNMSNVKKYFYLRL